MPRDKFHFSWHILSNYHVIKGASDIEVTLADRRSARAEVVGFDSLIDIAVLLPTAPARRRAVFRPARSRALVWAESHRRAERDTRLRRADAARPKA